METNKKRLAAGGPKPATKRFVLVWGILWEWVIIPVIVYFFPGRHTLADMFPKDTVTLLTGAALLGLGILWTLFSAKHLCSRGRGTIIPNFPPQKLVSSGVYNFTRNPMYLGYFFLFWAGAFLLRRFTLFLAGIGVILFIFTYIKFHEEKTLTKRFGADYHEYKQKVPIFLPKKYGTLSLVTWLAVLWVILLVSYRFVLL